MTIVTEVHSDIIFTCRCGHLLSSHKSCSQRSSTSGTYSHIFPELLSSVCYSLDHNTLDYIHPSPGMSYCTVGPEYLPTCRPENCEYWCIHVFVFPALLLRSVGIFCLI